MNSFGILALLLLNLSTTAVGADICLLQRLKIILVRNRLFFSVGDFVYEDGNIVSPDVKLQYLDLDGSFTTDGNIPSDILRNTTKQNTPGFTGDAFWTDGNETTVYAVGENADRANNGHSDGQSTLDAYDVKGDSWRSTNVIGGPLNKGLSLGAMYASASAGGSPLSFISGGSYQYAGGMVIFNSSNAASPSWKNVTSDDLPYLRGPLTQYARYGSQGVLIALGGNIADGGDADARRFNSVQIYDIGSGKWTSVTATGDVPPSRGSYCSALSAAPDDSSMHFILYGGYEDRHGNFDGDVDGSGLYMLILPAFQWIKINTTNADGLQTDLETRSDHSCVAYKDRQMLVFGGEYANFESGQKPCNSSFSPLRLLDLSTFQWEKKWPLPDTNFKVPGPVIDVVGGGPTGGAKPASTWEQTLGDNVALFSKTVPRFDPLHPNQNLAINNSTAGTADQNTNGGVGQSQSTPSGPSSGVIAGAVVGSVAGLALIILAIYLLFIRPRQKAQKQTNTQDWIKPELDTQTVKPSLSARFGLNRRHEMEANDVGELDGRGARFEAPARQPSRKNAPYELGT